MSFSPPLVGLCRVWVDADGSVTVPDGCVGFLHLDKHTDTQREGDWLHSLPFIEGFVIKQREHGGFSPGPLGVHDGYAGVQLDGFRKKIQGFLQIAYNRQRENKYNSILNVVTFTQWMCLSFLNIISTHLLLKHQWPQSSSHWPDPSSPLIPEGTYAHNVA